MSHFYTMVLVKDTTAIHDEVARLLAPYDEGIEVEAYPEPCWCRGLAARTDAAEAAVRAHGKVDDLRARYRKENPELAARTFGDDEAEAVWRARYIGPFHATEAAALAAHPRRDEPRSDCESCGGSGASTSTYNPRSRWDWWRVGGRWDGVIRNDPRESENGFNFADRHERPENNTRPTSELLPEGRAYLEALRAAGGERWRVPANVRDPFPFALVTPDGEWHEKGKMGWWAAVSDEKQSTAWCEAVLAMWEANLGTTAVACDLHI